MTPEIALTEVRSLVGVGLSILVVWWSTRWIPKRWARIYARIVVIPAVVIVLGRPASRLLVGSVWKGEWKCLVCGESQRRTSYRGLLLRSESGDDPPGKLASLRSEPWFPKEMARTHEHDWAPIGCHYSGSGISCHWDPSWSYFAALRSIPAPDVSRSILSKMLEASPSERRRMIQDFGWEEGSPFRATVDARVMSADEFEEAYAAWLDRHPRWK